jgi:hypothetical protein
VTADLAHPVEADEGGPPHDSPARQLGFAAACATTILTATWMGLFVFQLIALPTGWAGIEEHAERFSRLELANLWPALLLAWAYLVLLAALHEVVDPAQRVWTLAGLALGVVYATMATINYTVQIVMVAPNLLAGELEGLHVWAGANFDSVFWALALCYAVQGLSMALVARALTGTGWQEVVRRLFTLGAVSAPLQMGFGFFDWPVWVGVPATALWALGMLGGSTAIAFGLRTRHRSQRRRA